MSKAFPIKLGIYTLVFSYIICDLFVFSGPLKKAVDNKSGKNRERIADKMKQDKIAAYVYRQPIYLSQVDYSLSEWFMVRGYSEGEVSSEMLRVMRVKVLDYLIEDALFRTKTEFNEERFPIDQQGVAAALERLTRRFDSETIKAQAENERGLSGDRELSLRIAAVQQQEAYLDFLLKESMSVEDEDLRHFYETHKQRFTLPENVSARHIFLAHLEHPDDGEKKIKAVFEKLNNGEDFTKLAEQFSEDSNTKNKGGELGFFRKDRCLLALRSCLFGDKRIVEKQAEIVRSSLGFHIVELNAVKPMQQIKFEDVRGELERAMLMSETTDKLTEIRQRVRIKAGTIYRHTDTTKDSVTLKGKAYIIERFHEIFDEPYSYEN